MNDLVLAALGIGLGLGCPVGWWARGKHQRRNPLGILDPARGNGAAKGGWRWRLFGRRWLIRKAYQHVDDIIGATKYENQLRANARFRVIHKRKWYWWFVPAEVRITLADYFWPVPRIGPGVNPLPSDRRIARYVQASADLRTWTIWYTSEAPANHAPFIEWLTKGRPVQGGGLAQALGREWSPNLFQVERDWSAGLVRLTLNHKTDVPDGPVTADVGTI